MSHLSGGSFSRRGSRRISFQDCEDIKLKLAKQVLQIDESISVSSTCSGAQKDKPELCYVLDDKKYEFEVAYKSSKEYKNSLKLLINFTDNNGKTALHYAAYKGNFKLVQTLIENQANLYIRDNRKRVSL